jgi:hypothetical protein
VENHKKKYYINGFDSRSVSAFRILLGLVLIIDLLFYKLPYFQTFFAENAIMDSSLIAEMNSAYKFSLFYLTGSGTTAAIAIFIIAFISYVLLIIGYRTRLMAVIAYFLLFSIHQRNIFFLMGGSDDILRLSLFWSIFLPLGNHFKLPGNRQEKLPQQKNYQVRNIAVFAFIAQIGFIYFFNAISKTGETWKDGTAVSYALMMNLMKNFGANWLLAMPELCKVLTYFVKYGSILIMLLLFCPVKNNRCRIYAAILIFLFHWGMLPFLSIHHFCLTTLPFLILLMPSDVWDKFFRKDSQQLQPEPLKSKKKLVVLKKENSKQEILLKSFAGLSFFFIILININNLSKNKSGFVNFLKEKAGNCYGLNQKWAMFAPDPKKTNGILYTIGYKADGKPIILETNREYSDDLVRHEIVSETNLIPLPLVYLHFFARDVSVDTPGGARFWSNWIEYELEKYKKIKGAASIQKVIVLYVYVKSLAPGIYDTPLISPLAQKLIKPSEK